MSIDRTFGITDRLIRTKTHVAEQSSPQYYGLYWGFVVDDYDDQNHGRLKVYVNGISGGETTLSGLFPEGQEPDTETAIWCSPLMPSFGSTLFNDNAYVDEPISFGVVSPSPRKGDAVAVMFLHGDNRAVWIGSIPSFLRCMTVPGLPATKIEGETDFLPGHERSAEDPKATTHKAAGVLADNIKSAGLAGDLHRGTGISGMTRESPSRVSGWKTRGNPADGMPGHQLVFDDLPETQHVRLRTSTGHQLLLSDTAKCIYISTAKGNSRIELYENGDIEIFGEGDFSINARKNLNLSAGGNLNIDVTGSTNFKIGGDFKMKAAGAFHAKTNTMFVETVQEMNFKSGGKLRLSSTDEMHAKSTAQMFLQSGGTMHKKSGGFIYMDAASKIESAAGLASEAVASTAATEPTTASLPGAKTMTDSRAGTQGAAVQTVVSKLPQREPYVRDGRVLETALRVPEHGEPSPFDFDEHELMAQGAAGIRKVSMTGISKPGNGVPKNPEQGDVIENRNVKYLVVHGSAHSANSANVTLADIDSLHRRTDKVGNRLAYHYVIRRNGVVEFGVPTSPQVIHGNHTGKADYNRMSIGICMIGGGKAGNVNIGEANYTSAQLTSLRSLLVDLQTKFPSVKYIVGHREIKPLTACPSFDVQTWWTTGLVDETTRSPLKPTR